MFTALICLFGLVRASGWNGAGIASGIGYGLGGYSTYVAPSYTPVVTKAVYAAPVITKAVVPTYSYAAYAPAISTVSRYQVHSSPIVKTYVAPVSTYVAPVTAHVAPISSYSTYSSPYSVSYGHGYSSGYSGGYTGGYSGYGYGGHGSKYLW